MTEKTKYPIEFLNAVKELKDKGIIAEVKGKKDVVKLTKKGWKTNNYRYDEGTDDDDGDFLLIKKEDLEKLNCAVSGNSIFDDLGLPKILKGKYYVVRVMATREY